MEYQQQALYRKTGRYACSSQLRVAANNDCHVGQTKALMRNLEEQMFYLGTGPDLKKNKKEKKKVRNLVVASFVSSSSFKRTEEILGK